MTTDVTGLNRQWAGLESNKKAQSTENKEVKKNINANTLQNSMHYKKVYDELQQIIANWHTLTHQQRQSILRIVKDENIHSS